MALKAVTRGRVWPTLRDERAVAGSPEGCSCWLKVQEEDGAGRLLASHITPLLLRSPRPLDRLIQLLDANLIQTLSPAEPAWRAEVRRVHGAFWKLRLARDEAIRTGLARRLPDTQLQQGLFNRRAERGHSAALGDVERLIESLERRTATLEWCARYTRSRVRPLLILVPTLSQPA